MDIITRSEWGARSPRSGGFPTTSWANRTGFVVHYSAASRTQTVRAIQNYQMDSNGWRDIGYNFLVDYQGRIYEGCQGTWLAIGAHVAGHNTANIGVCAIGTDAEITPAHMRSIRWLYDEANRRAGKTLAKRYHSGMSGASTACPGNRLRSWVQNGMSGGSAMATLDNEDLENIAAIVWNRKINSPGLNRNVTAADWLKSGYGAELALRSMSEVLNVVASKVDLDPAELEAVKTAAREGAMAATAVIIDGVLAGLPDGDTVTKEEVKQALTEWFTPAVEG